MLAGRMRSCLAKPIKSIGVFASCPVIPDRVPLLAGHQTLHKWGGGLFLEMIFFAGTFTPSCLFAQYSVRFFQLNCQGQTRGEGECGGKTSHF